MSDIDSDSGATVPVQDPVAAQPEETTESLPKSADLNEQEDEEEEDEEDGMGLFGDDEDDDGAAKDVAAGESGAEEEEDEEIDEAELKTLEISLVRHSKSHHKLGEQTIKLQVPTFIGVDCKPFDPTKFQANVTEGADNSQQLDDKVLAENTVRWRYSTNRAGDVYRQSNTQIIEWDDGSFSLRLGGELFDIRLAPNEDNFLVMTHDDQDILQTQEILTNVAKIVPTSTASQVHKRLTKAIANRQAANKQHKMKSIILTEDPELRIKALEKAEEETFKARRRAELKKLHDEEKFERGSPAVAPKGSRYYYPGEEEDEEDDGIDVRKNEYDDDDGFIDDDEEGYDDVDEEDEEDELDKAAERLRKVKEAGAAKYQEKRAGDAEDDEEETVTRKKRRIISDDEDEE